MEIRMASKEDMKFLYEKTPQALQEGTLGYINVDFESIEEPIRKLLEKGAWYLVGKQNEQIVGWVLAGSITEQFTNKELGYIFELYVMPQSRGKGYAKPLMEAAIQRLKEQGYAEIRLNVYVANQAKSLYEKLGFQERNVIMSLK
ncbi:GNAT family N-acetyltransferase [Brevibacillus laterosporus]|uniref:GNAT family N-acetyltransferase n=1 Tax=Brevibacillus laterosporus TaxID=1465 RepID=UPI002651E32C|nr:GNAT family N-acetyltransferase [Brevibacillus laterosporus]MDN9012357.1 GNAT family N-acetyltransferase [Brevibacillus laterosporus]MDO0943456.1 GNAT family N-acetyltransferase [Brevibacillus laterosporus]